MVGLAVRSLCLGGVGLFAGNNEIGRFLNARREKVLTGEHFLRDPHAVAGMTRRGGGGKSCCLGTFHADHSHILEGLFQAICDEANFRNNWIIGFKQ